MRKPVLKNAVAVRFVVVILLGSSCFTSQGIADGQYHKGHHYRTYARSDVGWGWDSRSGWYAGPFYGRGAHGYFRCYDPGFGWHPCPHYLPANAAPKPPRGWWRYHFILPN